MEIKEIKALAKKYDWAFKEEQPKNYLLIFVRGQEQINVWWTKMTVGTVVPHLKHEGRRTQLYRKKVSKKELVKIFNRPRVHTGKGYFHKVGVAIISAKTSAKKGEYKGEYVEVRLGNKQEKSFGEARNELGEAWNKFFLIFCKEIGIEYLANRLTKKLKKEL